MAQGGALFVMALFIVSHGKSNNANFHNSEEIDALKHYYQNRREIFGILRSIAEFLSLLLLAQGIEPNPGPLAFGAESTNEIDLRNKKRLPPGLLPLNKVEKTPAVKKALATTSHGLLPVNKVEKTPAVKKALATAPPGLLPVNKVEKTPAVKKALATAPPGLLPVNKVEIIPAIKKAPATTPPGLLPVNKVEITPTVKKAPATAPPGLLPVDKVEIIPPVKKALATTPPGLLPVNKVEIIPAVKKAPATTPPGLLPVNKVEITPTVKKAPATTPPGLLPVNKVEITPVVKKAPVTTTCVDGAYSPPRYTPVKGDVVKNDENSDSDWDDDTSCSSIPNKKVDGDFINQFSRSETRAAPSMSDDFCSNSSRDSHSDSNNKKGACSDAFMNAVELLKTADREGGQSRNGTLRGVSMDDDFCAYATTDSDSDDNKQPATKVANNTDAVASLKHNEENAKQVRPVPLDDQVSSQCNKKTDDESDWDSDSDDSVSSHTILVKQNGKAENNVPKVTYYDVKDYADTDDDMDCYSDLEYDGDDDNDAPRDENKQPLSSTNIVPEKVAIELPNDDAKVTAETQNIVVKDESKVDDVMKSRSQIDVEAQDESDWDSDSEISAKCSSNIKVENVIPNDEKVTTCNISNNIAPEKVTIELPNVNDKVTTKIQDVVVKAESIADDVMKSRSEIDVEAQDESDWDSDSEISAKCLSNIKVENVMHNDVVVKDESKVVAAVKSRSLPDVEAQVESDWDSDSETSVKCSANIKVENVMSNDEPEKKEVDNDNVSSDWDTDSNNSNSSCKLERIPENKVIRSVSSKCQNLEKDGSDTEADLSDWDEDSIKSCESLPLDSVEVPAAQKALLQDTLGIADKTDVDKLAKVDTENIQSKEMSMVQDGKAVDAKECDLKKATFAPQNSVKKFNDHSSCDSASISLSDPSEDYAHMSNTDSIENIPSLPHAKCVIVNASDDVALMCDTRSVGNVPSLPHDKCVDATSKDQPLTVDVAQSPEAPASISESEGLVTCEEVFDWSAYMNKEYSKLPKEVQQAEQEKRINECISSNSDTSIGNTEDECNSIGGDTLDDISDGVFDVSDIEEDIPLDKPIAIDDALNDPSDIKQVIKDDVTHPEDAPLSRQAATNCIPTNSLTVPSVSVPQEHIDDAVKDIKSCKNVVDAAAPEVSKVTSNTSLDMDSFSLQSVPVGYQYGENIVPPSMYTNNLSTTFKDLSDESSLCEMTVTVQNTELPDGHSVNVDHDSELTEKCIANKSSSKLIHSTERKNLDTHTDDKPVDHVDIKVEILESNKLEQTIATTSMQDKEVFDTAVQVDKVAHGSDKEIQVEVMYDKLIREKGIQVELNDARVNAISEKQMQNKGINVGTTADINEDIASIVNIDHSQCIGNSKAIQVGNVYKMAAGNKRIQNEINKSNKEKTKKITNDIGVQVREKCTKEVPKVMNNQGDINRGSNSVINITNLVIHMNQMTDGSTCCKATGNKEPCAKCAKENDIETDKSAANVPKIFEATEVTSENNNVRINRKRKWQKYTQQKKKTTKTTEQVQPVVNKMVPTIERADFLESYAEPPNDEKRMDRKRKFSNLKENADKKLVKSTKSASNGRNEVITSEHETKRKGKKSVRFAEPEFDDSVLSAFYKDEPVSLPMDQCRIQEALNSDTTDGFLNKIVKLLRSEIEGEIEKKLKRCVQIRKTDAKYLSNNKKTRVTVPGDEIKPNNISMVDTKKSNDEKDRNNNNIGQNNDTDKVFKDVKGKKKDTKSRFSGFLNRIFK